MSRRLIVSLLAVCALAAFPAPPAIARAGEPGFAIEAAGFASYFRYRVEPGRKETGVLRVINRSRRHLTVLVRRADVTTAATGGLQYGTGPARADGRWLTLSRHRVRLAPGAVEAVRFRLRVPAGTRPGDHFAGIVALNRDDVRAARRRGGRRGLSLRFLPRLAIAVHARIPGGHGRELTTGAAGIGVAPSATEATLAVRNTGDLLVGETSGDLALMQGNTVLERQYLDLGAFVPNTEIRLRVPFEGTPARGEYTLRGTLRPAGGKPVRVNETIEFGDTAAREFKRDTGREARAGGVPASLVAVVAAALMLLLATLVGLVRRQRRQLAELSARAEGRPVQ